MQRLLDSIKAVAVTPCHPISAYMGKQTVGLTMFTAQPSALIARLLSQSAFFPIVVLVPMAAETRARPMRRLDHT